MSITDLLKGKIVNIMTDAKVVVQLEVESAEEKIHSRDLEPATPENDWYPTSEKWGTIEVKFTNGYLKSYSSLSQIDVVSETPIKSKTNNNLENINDNLLYDEIAVLIQTKNGKVFQVALKKEISDVLFTNLRMFFKDGIIKVLTPELHNISLK